MRWLLNLLVAAPAVFAGPVIDRKQTKETISGQWIAEVNKSPKAVLAAVQQQHGGVTPKHTYEIGSWKGVAFSADEDTINKLQDNNDFKIIERDRIVYAQALTKQHPAEWGLASISHHMKHQEDYIYDDRAGQGVDIYSVDTGIDIAHPEFEGRARLGPVFCEVHCGDNSSSLDTWGHGTHTSGIAASKTYGVAKKANLIGVRVYNEDHHSTLSLIVAGVQWAVKDNKSYLGRRAVINLSSTAEFSQTCNNAIRATVEAGVFVAVSAGNFADGDVNKYSPASEPSACNIGAIDIEWTKANFSNYGPGVDLYAPGVNLLSTWINNTTQVESGTSGSAPFVAGLAAYLIALQGEKAPAAKDLCNQIQQLSTKDMLHDLGNGSLNYLAYNGNDHIRKRARSFLHSLRS